MTTDQTSLGRPPALSTPGQGPAGPTATGREGPRGAQEPSAGGRAAAGRPTGERAQARRGGDRRRSAAVPARALAATGPREDAGAARGAALLVVVTVLVALGGGWAVTAATSPTYLTQAKVLVLPGTDVAEGASVASASAVAAQTPTWAALVETPAVVDPALEASGVDLVSSQAVAAVSASPEPGTSIVVIEARGATARDAAALASATAASLVEQIATRSAVGGTAQVAGSVVQEPEVPVAPASPDLLLNLAVAGAVGLAVALAVLVAARALALRRRGGADAPGTDTDTDVDAGAAAGESRPTRR